MKKTDLKYYLGIIFIIFVDSLHYLFFENNDRIDVYLYYDHKRYLTNILFDISNLFKFSILSYWLIRVNKKIFSPLFYTSLCIWPLYFLFYNQEHSLLIIPIYISLVFIYSKNRNK